MQIPEGYSTFGTVVGVVVSDHMNTNVDANKKYDLLTRQAIPIVLLGKFVDPDSNLVQTGLEFVCMTANDTVKGSRVPEQQTPWKSAGADISVGMSGWMAGVMTALMLLI